MEKVKTTPYFGSRTILEEHDRPVIRNDLAFDKQACDRIASKIFDGMDINKKGGTLSKDDLLKWTKAILQKKYPDVPFCEESFEKGYRLMD